MFLIQFQSIAQAEKWIPYFAAGDGWETEVFIMNNGGSTISIKAQIRNTEGKAQQVVIYYEDNEPVTQDHFSVDLPPHGTAIRKLTSSTGLVRGSIELTGANDDVRASADFRRWDKGAIISKGGVVPVSGTTFSFPHNVLEQQNTGIAVFNPNTHDISVHVLGYDAQGEDQELSSADVTKSEALRPLEVVAKMVTEILEGQYGAHMYFGKVTVNSSDPFYIVLLGTQTDQKGQFVISTKAVQ